MNFLGIKQLRFQCNSHTRSRHLHRSTSVVPSRFPQPPANMRTFVVFASLVSVAMAGLLPHTADQQTYIVQEQPSNNIGVDGYSYGYQLSDGQSRQESAQFESRAAPEEGVLRVRGSFSYFNPYDGQTYTVNYIADENGFQPQGAHLPVAPVA